MSEKQHTVNESNEKIRLTTAITRGEDTRNQEKHKLKARGETPSEAAENLDESLRQLEDRGVFERARDLGNDDE